MRLKREKEVMSFSRLVDTMEKYKLSCTHISSFSGHSTLEIRKYVQMRFSVIDNPCANRDIQQKKEKTHNFVVWRCARWFGGFPLLLTSDPAFRPLGSDPALNFIRKSFSNFPWCFKRCNWHDAMFCAIFCCAGSGYCFSLSVTSFFFTEKSL